jgi:hypothetical protein
MIPSVGDDKVTTSARDARRGDVVFIVHPQPLGDVFVYGTIDDHGWRACQDVHEIFSKAPDGRIVGDSG